MKKNAESAAILLLACGIIYIFCFIKAEAREIISLRSGESFWGSVVERTPEYIRVMDEAGYLRKYSYHEISDIKEGNAQKEPAPVYRGMTDESLSKEGFVNPESIKNRLEGELSAAEKIIIDTIKRFYPQPEAQDPALSQPQKPLRPDLLQPERDRIYRGHEKYY